jgi:hypothetical protein
MAAPFGSEPPRISTGPRSIPGSGGGIPGSGLPPAKSRPVHASAPLGGARAHRRRGLLIIGVLVLDLGLAAAGTWMLIEGLSASEPPPPPPARSEPAKSEPAPRPPGNASAAAGESPGRPADTVAAGEAPAAPADATSSGVASAAPASDPPAAAQGRKPKPAKKPARRGSAPIDPYGEPAPLPPEHRPPPPPPPLRPVLIPGRRASESP